MGFPRCIGLLVYVVERMDAVVDALAGALTVGAFFAFHATLTDMGRASDGYWLVGEETMECLVTRAQALLDWTGCVHTPHRAIGDFHIFISLLEAP